MTEPRPLPPGPAQPVVYIQPISPARAMAITASVLLVLGIAWLAIQIREILILLVIGILLGAAIDPIVAALRKRGLPRGIAILIVYLAIAAAIGIGLYFVVPPLIDQGQDLVANLPTYVESFRAQAAASQNPVIRTAVQNASNVYGNLGDSLPLEQLQVGQALGVLTSVVGVLFGTVSTLIVAYYWMTEKAVIKRVVLGLFPIAKRDRAHFVWDEIEERLGGWARGQLVLMGSVGIVSTIAYFALGLPFWFLLGIWAGLTEVIPIVGPWLGGALAVVVALTDSWQKAVVVAVFVLLLQQVEGSILVPRVMKGAVGLTPLTVILAVLVGGALGGILGALLAIPIAAVVQVLLSALLRAREEAADLGGEPAVAVAVSTMRVEDAASAVGGVGLARPPAAPAGDGGLPVATITQATLREEREPR